MNKEKKILAISKDDFDDIVLNRDGNVMIGALLKTASQIPGNSTFATLLALFMAEVREEVFSDKYVIGTKGKTAEADKL